MINYIGIVILVLMIIGTIFNNKSNKSQIDRDIVFICITLIMSCIFYAIFGIN